jgi:hypothetical protein
MNRRKRRERRLVSLFASLSSVDSRIRSTDARGFVFVYFAFRGYIPSAVATPAVAARLMWLAEDDLREDEHHVAGPDAWSLRRERVLRGERSPPRLHRSAPRRPEKGTGNLLVSNSCCRREYVFGEGAEHDTRGRVCSPFHFHATPVLNATVGLGMASVVPSGLFLCSRSTRR